MVSVVCRRKGFRSRATNISGAWWLLNAEKAKGYVFGRVTDVVGTLGRRLNDVRMNVVLTVVFSKVTNVVETLKRQLMV